MVVRHVLKLIVVSSLGFGGASAALAGDIMWNGDCNLGVFALDSVACTTTAPCDIKKEVGSTVTSAGTITSAAGFILSENVEDGSVWWAEQSSSAVTGTITVDCQ